MSIITDTKTLAAFCKELAKQDFLTIDTEFLRDKTYYPKLCLIQMAGPGIEAQAIDPLVDDIDLNPLFDLLQDKSVVKVFHAARQDLEIFYQLTGKIPTPLFDTQVAAMVCGFGDQIGYRNLVQDICNETMDKGAQFTDWSRRPLSKKQLFYALNDVIFLRDIYRHLEAELDKRKRRKWVEEEMAILTTHETYENPPEEAWSRVKIRSNKPEVLAVLREVAAWREREAQNRDVPRNRVMHDSSLIDIAVHGPVTPTNLAKSKGIDINLAKGRVGNELIAAVKRGLESKQKKPHREKKSPSMPSDLRPTLEMLKMLLKIKCSEHDVAQRLIASSQELELLAQDDKADIPALKGWRREVFGEDALALKHGKLAVSLEKGRIRLKQI